MSARMDGLMKALDSQIQKQEQSSDASVTKLHQGFAHLLSSIEKNTQIQNENLNKLLSDIVAKTSQATSGLISNVESLSAKNSNIVSGFTNLNENISKSVEKYQEAVNSTKSLIQSTSDLAGNLGSSLNQLASVQTKIDQTFHQFLEQTSVVQTIQKDNAESVQKYQSVFREVEGGLETVLKQIADNLQRYNDLTRTGLEGYLKQYDDSLSNATVKLSSTVKDLDELLENLGDHMDTIRTAVGATVKE
jgi:chromosome segregation ATPase